MQSSNGHSHKRLALAARFYFTDAVEVTDAGGVQVEEFGFAGVRGAHGVSPVSKHQKAERHFALGGKYSPRRWVELAGV